MAVTQHDDAVEIDGSQDTAQLKVQGHSTQTTPLQQWENSGGDVVAELQNTGRLQVGDEPGTPDALLEAHRDDTLTSGQIAQTNRGIHTSGHLTDEGGNANIEWSVHDVTLDGNNTDLAKVAALRAGVVKQGSGIVDEAVGLEVTDISGATDNYAIKTNIGKVQFGDLGAGMVKSDADGNLSIAVAGTDHLEPDLGTGNLKALDFPALTGDVTTPGNSLTATIANNAITTDKITDDAVSLAKLSHDGSNPWQAIGYNDSGAPTTLSVYPTRAEVMADTINMMTTDKELYINYTTLQAYGLYVWQQKTTAPNDADNGDEISISVVLDTGTYDFYVLGVLFSNAGIVDWYLNDTLGSPFVSGQDWYNNTVAYNELKSHSGVLTITKPGYHKIIGKINGQNASSSDHYFLLSKIYIQKSSD